MPSDMAFRMGSVGGGNPPNQPSFIPGEFAEEGEFKIDPAAPFGAPEKVTVCFDDPNNPTKADIAKVNSSPICDHFEIKDGRIQPKYVPIREKVKNPTGRTDFGWNEEMKKKHLLSAWGRGWRQFPYPRPPHNGVLHIVGGGPSLRRCIPELRRYARKKRHFIAALNKSHDFLFNLPKLGLGQAIKPWAAALLDPCDWVKDYITPHPGIQYFIGDQCSPETFDVFEKPGITKWVFRSIKVAGDYGIPPRDAVPIFGGSTVGLRFRTIGYMCGFREIHYWGFDSSAEVSRENPDGKMHGYEKVESVHDRLSIKIIDESGFEQEFITNSHMARQAQEWNEGRDEWIQLYREGTVQWIKEVFHGDGLLPTTAARLGLHADPKRNNTDDMQVLRPYKHENRSETHAG